MAVIFFQAQKGEYLCKKLGDTELRVMAPELVILIINIHVKFHFNINCYRFIFNKTN